MKNEYLSIYSVPRKIRGPLYPKSSRHRVRAADLTLQLLSFQTILIENSLFPRRLKPRES